MDTPRRKQLVFEGVGAAAASTASLMEKEKVGGTLIGCLDIARMGVGGVGVAAKAYAAANGDSGGNCSGRTSYPLIQELQGYWYKGCTRLVEASPCSPDPCCCCADAHAPREERHGSVCLPDTCLARIMTCLADSLEPGGLRGPSAVVKDLATAALVS
jgi:hypothetical protein